MTDLAPRRLTSRAAREDARRTRDAHWAFMEKVNRLGTVWWCIWNKYGREELPDEERMCLISGMELQEWMQAHPDWWTVGEWDDARYARPVQITDTGRAALRVRARYDDEDVTGGLVEPGFVVKPAARRD